MYQHDCQDCPLRAEWRTIAHDPPFAVLVALADGRLHERIELTWDFDDHCVEGTYTLGDDDGQDWCAAGGAVRGCACCGPYGCPRGHFLRTTYRSGSDSDAPAEPEEDLWAP